MVSSKQLLVVSYQRSGKKGCGVWEICCWLLVVGKKVVRGAFFNCEL
ncbi:hypothetical protein H6G17_07060 [Chroococcidiopsis sp. FACHB-1243]|nr:hypothetical protein [Chroococcidiopsis sp. [FACHB-1243]]MBD2305271.1 hypothetical protein [Chroococcidiopsis sp. [FACHB-1243]]